MENIMEFSINRSLCEVEFDRELKNIDVDVMEYIWFKIRESFLQNDLSSSITIKFTELSENVGKYQYQNQSLTDSIQRLNGIGIITNIKQNTNQKRFTFNFESYIKDGNMKGFTVTFNEKIYRLFDKPKSYNVYNQNNIYNLNTYYSKLLYKFVIGYKFIKQKSFYIQSDVLKRILNIHSNKSDSYIKSNFIDKSLKEISEKTDIEISMKKHSQIIKNGVEIVKYIVTIDKFKGSDMIVDLRKRSREVKQKSEYEIRLDKWIEDRKSEVKFDENSSKIPFVGIEVDDGYPIYIDDEYRLTNCIDNPFTKSPQKTLEELNNILQSGGDVKVIYNEGFPKSLSKVCLLSQSELRSRGKI